MFIITKKMPCACGGRKNRSHVYLNNIIINTPQTEETRIIKPVRIVKSLGFLGNNNPNRK